MRYLYSQEKLEKMFTEMMAEHNLTLAGIATSIGVHKRTLTDWRKGKITIPDYVIKKIETVLKMKMPTPDKCLPDFWAKSIAGRKGGLRAYALHGNPATHNDCQKGGLKAIKNMRKKQSGPFIPKQVQIPAHSTRLAEFVGILLGDGGLTRRQVYITLHKTDDHLFAIYVKKMIKQLFKYEASLRERRGKKIVIITISRTNLVKFFNKMGLPAGNKVKNQVDAPDWIKRKKDFIIPCLRGLLDTDGCFYTDKHKHKKTIYLNCAVNFTNRSLPLLLFFKKNLEKFGFHPTQKTKFSLFLRRENEILKYFGMIGSSNPKHLKKFKFYFIKKYGRVPKWT